MHKKYNLLAPLMKKQKIKSNIVNAHSQIFSVAVSLLEFVVAICSGKLPEKICGSIYQWNLQVLTTVLPCAFATVILP